MTLTALQLSTLKNDILADTQLSALPRTADGCAAIAAIYNAGPSLNGGAQAAFFVYRTNIAPQEIFDQITWANFTPSDAPDATVQWSNRSLAAQGKQFNLQTMLVGSTVISAGRPNVRAGLQDALTNLPTGAAGVLVSGGWVGVRDNVLARAATRAEKLFATTAVNHDGVAPATAATMVVEGAVTGQNVADALGV